MDNNTEVVFDNIEQRILTEIKDAHYSIFVSVAWFTNKKLFNALLEKAQNNCYVSIIIQLDDINSQSGIDYSQIQIGRSECFKISKEAELLHDKFCVIDFQKVITGSYNWTYKASHNSENILILNDPSVATQYISRFEQQKTKFKGLNISTRSSDSNILNNSSINVHKTNTIILSKQTHCCSCKRTLGIDDIFCNKCGAQQKMSNIKSAITCNKCSHEQVAPILSSSTKYCTNCGNKLMEKNDLSPNKCPICKNDRDINSYYQEFCTFCGLSNGLNTWFSDKILNNGRKRVVLKGVRPEFSLFEQYQKCYKCNGVNLWEANYCRRCGENISMHAKDKYDNEWVDIGLSVLWSTKVAGHFYRWMDTERFTYDGVFSYFSGKRKNKDTASELFGHKWRMPTKVEVEELIERCEWEKIIEPPHNYPQFKVTGPNGNHILLNVEKNDMGWNLYFWTSTEDEDDMPFAFYYFDSNFSSPLNKRKIRIRKDNTFRAHRIIPVADKKWQGKL